MAHSLKLMEIFAHPDDESLDTGGTLVKYAAEGIETNLVTATRGEHGWRDSEADYPGPDALILSGVQSGQWWSRCGERSVCGTALTR